MTLNPSEDRFGRAISGMKWLAIAAAALFLAAAWGSRR